MLFTMYSELFQLVSIVNITAICIGLALLLSFCWYQWRMTRAYGRFCSKRLDTRWILKAITGQTFRNNVKWNNVAFTDLVELAKTFQKEGICTMWFLKPYILVYNQEFMKHLVNEVNLGERATHYDINRLIMGNGLLTSKHDVWKVHRKLLNPAFKLSALKNKMSGFNKSASQLVENIAKLADKPVDNIIHFINICIMRNMAEYVLGLDMDREDLYLWSLELFGLIDSGAEEFIERLSRPWLYWNSLLPYFESGRKYLKVTTESDNQMHRVFDEVSKCQENKESFSEISCANILMKLYQDSFLTRKDVEDHMLTLTAGGFETVSNAIQWCLYSLGNHPQIQENAYREIQSIVPDGDITYENLTNLKYLDCVIKESLRLYSTVPIIGRKASEDIQCGKYIIPKGAEVVFFIFMLHRDPIIFPDPEKFDPERFSDSSALRPWMYMPFAEGYRSCIGKKYGLMQMKIILAYILRRFRLTSLNRIDDNEFNWEITLKPMKPLRFLFEDRHAKNFVQEVQRENFNMS